jgi:hypothetical protein
MRAGPVPSQRLTSGELVFLAHDVPPFAARPTYTIVSGAPHVEGRAIAEGATLTAGPFVCGSMRVPAASSELTAKA